MSVLLRHSGDLPPVEAYGVWYAVTGAAGKGADDKKLEDLARMLEAAFDAICPEWWAVARTLADGDGAELAYATTCAGYGSDFGLMMAWGRLTKQMARETEPCLVICDDPWLFRHLAVLSGVQAGKEPGLLAATLKYRLRGFLARSHLVPRLAWASLATRRQRPRAAKGGPVILVYGHPRSNAQGHDDYFGPMMSEIPALARALHTDCGTTQAAALSADGRTVSLHAWGNPLQAVRLLLKRWRPTITHLSGSFGWLVRRAAEKEGGGAAHAMNAWQRQCQHAWLTHTRPAVVAWPWENHGWERDFCRRARRLGITTLGYQHTVIGPHQLNFSPTANKDGLDSLPDIIVCDGPAYRDQLLDWGVPAERLVIGGSLRIGRFEGGLYDPKAPCFVALSADHAIARQQVGAIKAAAAKGIEFLVKDHPMYPLDFEETENIRRTTETLEAQPALSSVLYSTGTLGLEGLLAGLPTFRFLPEDRIAVDILPGFVAVETVTAPELTDALAEAGKNPSKPDPLPWEDVLSPVDWDLWRKLLAGGKPAAAPEPAPSPKENIA
ncbi:MAG: hypothetical protein IH994_00405 [Proteobacteria bacterium]|nr:hypothetical protein [Pseudomonadota bacterium]